jgi:hypothetical protein
MAADQNLAARMLDPKTQAGAALELSRLGSSSEEAATWAVAAAVFSLRDTVAEAMNAKAAAPAVAEPDRSQLTPEEVAEIQRASQDFMNRPLIVPLGGVVGSQAPRPAVTREQVAVAIGSGVGKLCVQRKGKCLVNTRCLCTRQTDAVMKLLEGGE